MSTPLKPVPLHSLMTWNDKKHRDIFEEFKNQRGRGGRGKKKKKNKNFLKMHKKKFRK